jgi:2-C-methyl-D-erythritol 4-phosphate cytidylyltransferase
MPEKLVEYCDIVLVAGGNGTRYKSEIPKQFDCINGQPLYLWSLNTFLSWPSSKNIVIVAPKEWVEPIRSSFESLESGSRVRVVEGGKSRQESATLGVLVLREISNLKWVMIHDAARPAVTEILIDRIWNARLDDLQELGGVIPGVPVQETIKEVTNELAVAKTLSRDKLRVIQTPQLLIRDLLNEAYLKFENQKAVDDASLLEQLGYKIIVVDGEYDNVKVTFAEDRERVSDWLRNRHPSL